MDVVISQCVHGVQRVTAHRGGGEGVDWPSLSDRVASVGCCGRRIDRRPSLALLLLIEVGCLFEDDDDDYYLRSRFFKANVTSHLLTLVVLIRFLVYFRSSDLRSWCVNIFLKSTHGSK